MRLLDTNIFMYASGAQHPYKEPCADVLAMVENGTLDANTDVEVFQEILHNYQSRRQLTAGITVTELALASFPAPFLVTAQTISLTLEVMLRHQNLQTRDAIHAAVVFEYGLEGIVSADEGST